MALVLESNLPALKVLVCNGSKGSTATLKAVWAEAHYSVDVSVAKKKDLSVGFAPDQNPALICGNDVVLGGGGNAMCNDMFLIGGAGYSSKADK